MATKIFDLFGDVSLKTGDVQKGLDQVKSKAEAVGKKLNQVGQSLTRFGSMMTTRVTLPLVALGTFLVKLGSNAEEVRAKFNTAFRNVREQADRTATALARDYGLSRTAAERLLSSTGDLMKGFGATGGQALDLSNKVQELAVDLASYNNVQGGASTASEILTKAMLGERDALTSLGIKISDADVQQRLLETGQENLTGRALLLAKAETTLALAYEQSGDALGDFARTSDSFANQVRILKGEAEDLAVSFKKFLLPIAKDLIAKARDLVAWFMGLDEASKQLVLGIAAITAALGPVTYAVGVFSKAMAVLAANPITATVVAIAAVVAGLTLLVVKWRQHHNLLRENARIGQQNNEVLRATSIALNETKLSTVGNIEAQLRYTEALLGRQQVEKEYNEFEIESFKDRIELLESYNDAYGEYTDPETGRRFVGQALTDEINRIKEVVAAVEGEVDKRVQAIAMIEETRAGLEELRTEQELAAAPTVDLGEALTDEEIALRKAAAAAREAVDAIAALRAEQDELTTGAMVGAANVHARIDAEREAR